MFQTSSIIEKVQTMVDGGVKLTVVTQELDVQAMTALFSLKGKQGWMLFKENVVVDEDIPVEDAPEIGSKKTPAERLTAVLYVFWNTNTNKVKPFDTFYKEWMEKKIEEIKQHLPE